MERITSAQPPPCLSKHPPLDLSDMSGMDFPMYVYKPRRGMKRGDDSKDTYKLPHRLIEKKRRDRINECIAQLKDLLPEHLKLTTLGHLEKAVVLELTLKHVKALNTLLEQQQQQIISLQNGMQIGDHGVASSETSEEMFRSGFHLCAKEVLQYLASQENPQELTASHVVNHLHKVASDLLQRPASPCLDPPSPVSAPVSTRRGLDSREKTAPASGSSGSGPAPPRTPEGHAKNCVPVIQRTYPHSSEQSGSDTDTDSGYGGEVDKRESVKAQRGIAGGNGGYYGGAKDGVATRPGSIKEERDEPPLAKRPRSDSSEDESLSGHEGSVGNGHGTYVSFSPHQPPLCMPFYLIPPSAAYLPMLEKCWYPGMPMLYPGLGGGGGAPAAVLPHDKLAVSPRATSPAAASIVPPTPMDSPALLQALKQVPPLNLETKD